MDFANTVVGCCHGFLRNYESCHCSNLSFLILFSISRELRFKKKLKRFFEIRNLVIEYCESNLRNSKFCIQIWLLKCFQYPRCDLFYRLFRIGQRTCKFEYMKFFMIFKFQYMIFLMISFNFFFKKIFKSWRSERCSWVLSRFSQELRVLWLLKSFFSDFFFQFPENLDLKKKLKRLKFATLLLSTVRVISGILSFVSKCDCSNAFSIQNVTCFASFQNWSKNL